MLQVVFGDSEKGSLVQAMRFRKDGFAFGIGLLHGDDVVMTEQEKEAALAEARHRHEQELARGEPLDGNPEDAIALPFPLDIGDIRGSVLGDARKELLREIFSANPWGDEYNEPDTLDAYWNNCQEDHRQLLRRAAAGEAVRIWYSGAPYSLCGYYSVLHMLRDVDCTVTAVRLPEYWEQPDGTAISYTSFGEVSAGDWAAFLSCETTISSVMRAHHASFWEQLQRENAPLRAVINGRLHSVEEDFYDRFLLRQLTSEPQTVGSVIGTALGRDVLLIGDWFLACRMKKLIDTGVIQLESQGNGFYGSLVRLA